MSSIIVTRTDLQLLGLLSGHAPLLRKLAHARIVPASQVPPDVVTMDSRVRYSGEANGVHRHVKLVYPQKADGRGQVSVLSPLGTALLGSSAGQEIEWDFPGGGRRRIRVEEVVSQPERHLVPRPSVPASYTISFSLGF